MTTPHSNDPFARRVLDRIEGEGLAPRPRWEFIFKNSVFWALGALAVALGALAFSAALFEVENAGWRFYAATNGDLIDFFFSAAPFIWAVALLLFIALGYANVRHTRRGYRYPLAVIALGAVLTSVALGTALYAVGVGAALEEGVGDHPPFYRPILLEERAWWQAPERGLLGGQIVGLDHDGFMLQDFSGHLWDIESDGLPATDAITVARGGTVRVIGLPASTTSSVFYACFVFPWPSPSDRALPPPAASTSERTAPPARSEECKDIRPYAQMRALDEHGSF